MEARCPRGPGAATTATPQGARTPNWPTQCYHCMEGWEGLLETSKPSKNHPQPQNCNNKYSTRTETACKTVKTDKCSHSSSQNANLFRYGVDKWSIQRFCGYSRSVEAHNGRLDQRETGIQM